MTVFLSRTARLVALGVLESALLTGTAAAQTGAGAVSTASLAMKVGVPAGDIVYVTDDRGVTVKARFAFLTADGIEILVNGKSRTIAAAQVRRIAWQQRDSPLAGMLIGAAIGAIPGIYYLATDPNECTGLCPEEYALIGIGALVGGLIDLAITNKVTVYEWAPAGGRARRLSVACVLALDHKVVHISIRF